MKIRRLRGSDPSTIIILDPTDNITQLKESDTWNQIEFALTYPEYNLPLKLRYQLLVPSLMTQGPVSIWSHNRT
jgi:hypothetical protein